MPAGPRSVSVAPSGFGKPLPASRGLIWGIALVLAPTFVFLMTGSLTTLGIFVLPVLALVAFAISRRDRKRGPAVDPLADEMHAPSKR